MIAGQADPVVQVIDESDGQIVYTLRIKGREFRPKVFQKGTYTIRVGQQDGNMKEFRGVKSLGPDQEDQLRLDFSLPPERP